MISSNHLIVLLIALSIILPLVVSSCKSAKSDVDQSNQDGDPIVLIREKSDEILGAKSEIIANSDSTLWLCRAIEYPITNYMVIHMDGHVVRNKKGVRGSVTWEDSHSLKVERIAGRKEESPTTFIINLKEIH